jgi:hypothetical protein
MKLGTKTKQPGERRSYTINYIDAITSDDLVMTAALKTTPPSELVVDQITVISPRVRFFVAGGTDGVSYKLTFVVTTNDGVTFEDEVTIKVKEQ